MRLRNWIAVLISVLLLAGAGVVGILVNRSTVEAVETVHQNDTTALGTNNGTLTGQLQKNSVRELTLLLGQIAVRLAADDAKDGASLAVAAKKSTTFQYGMITADLDGNFLTASRTGGLPAQDDPAWAPLWDKIKTERYGFSGVMNAGDTYVAAVGIPVTVGGGAVGYLIGLNEVGQTPLHNYIRELRSTAHETMIVDTAGRIGAASDDTLIGGVVHPDIKARLDRDEAQFVEYTENGRDMIAVVVGGLTSDWSYVRTQTKASFDGAVYSRSQTLNLTLLAMLVIGVVGITLLGYRTQIQRRRADERFQALFQHAPDLVSVLDGTGRIVFSSPSTTSVLGFAAGSRTGHSVFEVVHPEDQQQMREGLTTLLSDPSGVLRLQCRVRTADGEYRWFDFTASNQMQNAALSGVVINARDISENRAFQERLEHEAQHDPLTGLPNRRRMQDKLHSSLRADSVAVLFVDLDGFKPVNDAHGHEVGDELLRQVADRLSACVRASDVLARVGGDEFVMLMPGVVEPGDVDAMSNRVRYVLGLPFRIDGHEIQIGASVGVHLAPAAGDPDEALRAADHAMYEIKHSRRVPAGTVARVGRHRAPD
ncbi:sensor domain-containing diguanylate cyclase [Actinoplanes flavus]|uniref:Diguanylate cyclase n=1 Tax=Actinoplanes flavus TaxID=2820290 RepID=A0ABS3UB35_9ACTN|nr:sensor domain-containing diguanylate cyclase [Actinoplanes flavus]MBO3735982.1 diguanylate cyclase [Actinoplanes flavus]